MSRKQLQFVKAQTNGNDFVIFDSVESFDFGGLAKSSANRKLGIGADQIVFLDERRSSVKFYNSDGSEASMCGNGLCAVATYLNAKTGDVSFKANIGQRSYFLRYDNGMSTITLDSPRLEETINDGAIINVGNRHLVVQVEALFDAHETLLKLSQKHKDLNIHCFTRSENNIELISFERGAGFTNACGSGAISVCFCCGQGEYNITNPGGPAYVEITETNATFSASSEIVFEGVFYV